MKTVSKERLEELANAEYCKANPGKWLLGLAEINAMARELLALREGDKQEPVAEIREDLNRLFIHIHSHADLKAGDRLYTAPPAPVVPDYMTIPMIREKLPHISFSEAAGYSAGWNACRAAMLAAEPVSNAYKLPDWWIKCSERMPNHEQQVWAHFKFDDGTTATGFAIWDDEEKDWYFELDECGDLIARGKLIKNPDICVANITHWMPLPAAPGKEG